MSDWLDASTRAAARADAELAVLEYDSGDRRRVIPGNTLTTSKAQVVDPGLCLE